MSVDAMAHAEVDDNRIKASIAVDMSRLIEGSLDAAMQTYIGQPNTPLVQAQIKQKLDEMLDSIDSQAKLKRQSANASWVRSMHETIAKKLRGEDLTEDELQDVYLLLRGIAAESDISGTRKQQYKTLLRRMERGEDFIFMDANVLANLGTELNGLQGAYTRMKVTNVEVDGNRIKASVEVDPTMPANLITITVTADAPLCDVVTKAAVVPSEVARKILDRKVNEMVDDVAHVLQEQSRDSKIDLTPHNKPFEMRPIEPGELTLKKLPNRLDFTVKETLDSGYISPKAFAKVTAS